MAEAVWGMLAEFASAETLIAAARRARKAGYRRLDAFTPFPVPELKTALRLRDNRVLWLGLLGGLFGCALAFAMQFYTNYSYPINVGGRPIYAVSAFAVIAFELTVLFAALTPAIGMLALNGLPRLHHPVFDAPQFRRASRDRFFLCIEADDGQFAEATTRRFLDGLNPISVEVLRG